MDYASVYAGGGAGGAPAMAAAGGAGGGAGVGAADATLSVDWGEARTYINDIIMLYESDTEETKVLAQIKQLRADIAAMAAGRETDAKKVIMELQQRISRTDAHATEVIPAIEEVRARIQSLEAQKAKLVADMERMRATKDTSVASLQSLSQQMAALKHSSQVLMADHTATVPRVRHSLSLYATISNIRWDYDAPDAVAGYIAPPDGAPVRPFHLDPRVTAPKGIADALWAKIGEASGVAPPAHAAPAAAASRGPW